MQRSLSNFGHVLYDNMDMAKYLLVENNAYAAPLRPLMLIVDFAEDMLAPDLPTYTFEMWRDDVMHVIHAECSNGLSVEIRDGNFDMHVPSPLQQTRYLLESMQSRIESKWDVNFQDVCEEISQAFQNIPYLKVISTDGSTQRISYETYLEQKDMVTTLLQSFGKRPKETPLEPLNYSDFVYAVAQSDDKKINIPEKYLKIGMNAATIFIGVFAAGAVAQKAVPDNPHAAMAGAGAAGAAAYAYSKRSRD